MSVENNRSAFSCIECGYDLRGSIAPAVQCPECGRNWSIELLTAWNEEAELEDDIEGVLVLHAGSHLLGILGVLFCLVSLWALLLAALGIAAYVIGQHRLRRLTNSSTCGGKPPIDGMAGSLAVLLVLFGSALSFAYSAISIADFRFELAAASIATATALVVYSRSCYRRCKHQIAELLLWQHLRRKHAGK